MKLTKTSLLAIVGLIAALLTINGDLINISAYAIEMIVSALTLIIYNIFSMSENKPSINIISVLGLLVGLTGLIIDKPIIDAAGVQHYLFPIAYVSAIKNSLVVILRFIQTGTASEVRKNQ